MTIQGGGEDDGDDDDDEDDDDEDEDAAGWTPELVGWWLGEPCWVACEVCCSPSKKMGVGTQNIAIFLGMTDQW